VARLLPALDDFQPMRNRLAELGRADYGVRPEQYETLYVRVVMGHRAALEADFDPSTREAWHLAITAICAAMKAGVE
jgi:hypothetical protein